MLKLNYLQKAIDDFGNKVVADAKENLKTSKKISSGDLQNSLKCTGAIFHKQSIELGITMTDYGAFVDKGVSGIKVKYDTPYSYKDKMPPTSKLDGWVVRNGLAPRNEKGRFASRSSIKFAIAKSIFYNGIKPSKFLTNAVRDNMKIMPKKVQDAFSLDLEGTINFIIKSNF